MKSKIVLGILLAAVVVVTLPFFVSKVFQLFPFLPSPSRPAQTPRATPQPPEVFPSAWLEVANTNLGKKKEGCVAANGYKYLCEEGYEERAENLFQLANGISPNGLWWATVKPDQTLQILAAKDGQVLSQKNLELPNVFTFIPYWSSDSKHLIIMAGDHSKGCQKTAATCQLTRVFFFPVTDNGELQTPNIFIAQSQKFSPRLFNWSADSAQVVMFSDEENAFYFFDVDGKLVRQDKLPRSTSFIRMLSVLWKSDQLWYTTISMPKSHVLASDLFSLQTKDAAKPHKYFSFDQTLNLIDWDHTKTTPDLLVVKENRALPFLEDTHFWLNDPMTKAAKEIPAPKYSNLGGGTYCGMESSPTQPVTAVLLSDAGSCDSNVHLVFFDWEKEELIDSGEQIERLLPWNPTQNGFTVVAKDETGKHVFKIVKKKK